MPRFFIPSICQAHHAFNLAVSFILTQHTMRQGSLDQEVVIRIVEVSLRKSYYVKVRSGSAKAVMAASKVRVPLNLVRHE
jgi:hypothetical protein